MAEDVRQWLEELELGQYADAFVDNAVDLDLLVDLTEADLEKLGVAALGHRKRLLRAIAALSDNQGAAASTSPTITAASELSGTAERRQLTVLFCDLVGSTALSQRLDPEDLRDVMLRYQDAVSGAVARYGGHVAKFLGDGVLAYFGWPQAYEDQAERAVRAGLDSVQAVGRVESDGGMLQGRVGIATGQVVVGDLVGAGGRDAEAVSGPTPNLAARLQGLAEPEQVLLGEQTRRLVGDAFELEELGRQSLKGFDSVLAWRAIGERSGVSRFQAAHGVELTRFVGRRHELGLLHERWELACEGEGQVVLISGEPGIGKSRIVETLDERVREIPHSRLHYQCSPYHTSAALYPVIQQLERAAGFTGEDGAAARLEKLEALLADRGADGTDTIRLFAELLSIPYEAHFGRLDLPPQRRKDRILEALIEQLLRLSGDRPLLVVFEDTHWIDPTSQEFLDHLMSRLAEESILLLITHRPEWRVGFDFEPHVAALSLSRLGRAQVAEMIRALAGSEIDERLTTRIAARTDGIPLFIEEVTKSVLEASDDASEIPDGLHASLLARLDRLEDAKEIAQLGSVVGREFSYRLLAAVAERPLAEIEAALERLVRSQLVFRKGLPPEASYTFKHALVQDTAYDSLLKSRRQVLHGRIAETLEKEFPEIVLAEPETLARHFEEAGAVARAIDYWEQAAQRNLARFAQAEAAEQLGKAVSLALKLPAGGARDRRELALLLPLGEALFGAIGGSAPETEAAFYRAKDLAGQNQDFDAMRRAYYGLFIGNMIASRLDRVIDDGRELECLKNDDDPETTLLVSSRILGGGYYLKGEVKTAEPYLERCVAFSRQFVAEEQSFDAFAHDPVRSAHSQLANVKWVLGYPQQALELAAEGLQYCSESKNLNTKGVNGVYVGLVYLLARASEAAFDQGEALLRAAEEHGSAYWSACGDCLRGGALIQLGEAERGVALLAPGIDAFKAGGGEQHMPFLQSLLAVGYLVCGMDEASRETLASALAIIEATGQNIYLPAWHLTQGDCQRRSGAGGSAAEEHFQTALKLARAMQSKAWELRAAIELAPLWHQDGRSPAARDLLAPIYDWFTEGFDTPDLKDAKALLEQLD